MDQEEMLRALSEVVSGLDQANLDFKDAAKTIRPSHPEKARHCDRAAERVRNLHDIALSIQRNFT